MVNNQKLDMNTASELLTNILESCNAEPTTISLKTLVSNGNYRRRSFSPQKLVSILSLAICFTIPTLFMTPSINLDSENSEVSSDSAASDFNSPTISLNLDESVPVSKIHATGNSKTVPVSTDGSNSFNITPTENGTYSVTVTLANNQEITQKVVVDNVDNTAPTLVGSSYDDEFVTLSLNDDMSGIVFDDLYAVDAGGAKHYPVSCDKTGQTVVFEHPENDWKVFLSDYAGNDLTLFIKCLDTATNAQ